MPKKKELSQIFTTVAAITIIAGSIAGLSFGSLKASEAALPASKGVTYLEEHGYTDITGGDVKLFAPGCGKYTFPREYSAVNEKTGTRENKTVCLTLTGARGPAFGG